MIFEVSGIIIAAALVAIGGYLGHRSVMKSLDELEKALDRYEKA